MLYGILYIFLMIKLTELFENKKTGARYSTILAPFAVFKIDLTHFSKWRK